MQREVAYCIALAEFGFVVKAPRLSLASKTVVLTEVTQIYFWWGLQHRNPESKKVADMAVAAGEAWRRLDPSQKVRYEELSKLAKVTILVALC